MLDNNIHEYRSSLITAIGIILGFLLGFAANWATQTTTETDWSDYSIAICLSLSIMLMIRSLYRSLDNHIHPQGQGIHYQTTLKIFMIALIIYFVGVFGSIVQTIVSQ